MENRVITFGRFEAASIFIHALIIKVLLGLPQLLCAQAGSAAWMIALISGIVFLILVWIISALYRCYEGKNILQIAEETGGKVLKWCIGVALLLPLLFKGGITLRLAAETLNLITPYRLPTVLTAVLVGAAMVVAAYRGIETVARLHALLLPVILLALSLVVIASLGSIRLDNLFPFWGLGRDKVLAESFGAISMYTDLLYLFLLYPYVKSRHTFSRAMKTGAVVATIVQLVLVLCYVLTTQYPESGELFMPIYQVSRIIRLGDNSQSIEAIFYPIWILSSLLYLSLSLTFAMELAGQLTHTKYQKLFILPFAGLMFSVGYLPESVLSAMRLSSSLSPLLSALAMLLPTLVLVYARAGRRKMRES